MATTGKDSWWVTADLRTLWEDSEKEKRGNGVRSDKGLFRTIHLKSNTVKTKVLDGC